MHKLLQKDSPPSEGTPAAHVHAALHAHNLAQESSAFSLEEGQHLHGEPTTRPPSPTQEQLDIEARSDEEERAHEESMLSLIESNLSRPDPRDDGQTSESASGAQGQSSDAEGSELEQQAESSDLRCSSSTGRSETSSNREGKNKHRNVQRKRRRQSSGSNTSSYDGSRSHSPMDQDA